MRRTKTLGIVIHRAEVTSNTDYHFLIGHAGDIRQLVPQDDVGEHALKYNKTTIGIAVFGDFASKEKGRNYHPTTTQIVATIALIKRLQAEYGPLWVTGHTNLGIQGTRYPAKLVEGHTCPGENFPLQYVIEQTHAVDFPLEPLRVKIS
ncbi:MAG: N-acetylmuramoyl-L-alanine amidase [Janthinobacterium lividum]